MQSMPLRSGTPQPRSHALVALDLPVIAGGTVGAGEAEAVAVGAVLVPLALADGVVDLALALAGGACPFEHRPVVLYENQLAHVTLADEPRGAVPAL